MNLRTLTLFALTTALVASCTKKDNTDNADPTSAPSVAGTRHFRSMKCHSVFESIHSATSTSVGIDTKDTSVVPDIVLNIVFTGADKLWFQGHTLNMISSTDTLVFYSAQINHSTSESIYYYPVENSVRIWENTELHYTQGDTLSHHEYWDTYYNSL